MLLSSLPLLSYFPSSSSLCSRPPFCDHCHCAAVLPSVAVVHMSLSLCCCHSFCVVILVLTSLSCSPPFRRHCLVSLSSLPLSASSCRCPCFVVLPSGVVVHVSLSTCQCPLVVLPSIIVVTSHNRSSLAAALRQRGCGAAMLLARRRHRKGWCSGTAK
jgi:hypothetical protein